MKNNNAKLIKELNDQIKRLRVEAQATSVKNDTNIGLIIADIMEARDKGNMVLLKNATQRLLENISVDRNADTNPDLITGLVDYTNTIREYLMPERFNMDMTVRAGTVFLVGAGVGVGKSTWLANYLYDCIMTGKRCILFSLEMTSYDFWIKLFQIHLYHKTNLRFDYMTMLNTIKNNKFDKVMNEYIEYASERAWIVDATKFTASDIVGYMELAKNKWDGEEPQFTFIDYAQLIRPEPYTQSKEKRHQMDETMKLLTNKAVSSGSVVMVASQLSRMAQNENFDSTTAFKESSALEEDSAVAMLLKRDRAENGEYEPFINVSVVKNRYGKIMKKQIYLIPEIGYLYT